MPPVLDPSRSKVDGLAFIGLSLARKADEDGNVVGHPGSSTHQESFDFNRVLDRDYECVSSTNDDGWLAGGGEPGPPDSYKLAARDSSHVEIMRIGTYVKEWGGIPVEDVVEAIKKGEILIPVVEVVPTAVVANNDVPPELEIRFDMDPPVPDFEEDEGSEKSPLPVNWQLRFLHNQLFRRFEFPSRFCPGAFHSTIVRKAEFRTPKARDDYFAKCEKVVEEWRKEGPKPLVAKALGDGVVRIESGTSEKPSQPEHRQSGIWLFEDRENITHFFEPNFLPPYGTPEKRKIILDLLKEEWDEKTLSWKPVKPMPPHHHRPREPPKHEKPTEGEKPKAAPPPPPKEESGPKKPEPPVPPPEKAEEEKVEGAKPEEEEKKPSPPSPKEAEPKSKPAPPSPKSAEPKKDPEPPSPKVSELKKIFGHPSPKEAAEPKSKPEPEPHKEEKEKKVEPEEAKPVPPPPEEAEKPKEDPAAPAPPKEEPKGNDATQEAEEKKTADAKVDAASHPPPQAAPTDEEEIEEEKKEDDAPPPAVKQDDKEEASASLGGSLADELSLVLQRRQCADCGVGDLLENLLNLNNCGGGGGGGGSKNEESGGDSAAQNLSPAASAAAAAEPSASASASAPPSEPEPQITAGTSV